MPIYVSVIVPIYNVEKYLYQCLFSIIKQSLENIEIICIDDGSTDNSGMILNYFSKKDHRIIAITTPNRGYGHAMNLGLSLAHGKYIGIVEPDDYISYDMLEYLYDAAEITGAEIVKSDFFRFINKNGKIERHFQPCVTNNTFYGRLINPQKEKQCFRFIMNIWCGLYERKLLSDYHIKFNETPGASFQDNGFWFQTMCYAQKIYYINQPFYMNRRDNPESSVNQQNNLYACNIEFNLIRKLMKENKVLEKNFLDVYMVKKYETYKFNLNRISKSNRTDYIKKLSSEWQVDLENKEIKKEYFYPEEWDEIMLIVTDPAKYAVNYFDKTDVQGISTDQSENNFLKSENENLKYEINEIKKSFSYRIGLSFTKLLRIIRKKFR